MQNIIKFSNTWTYEILRDYYPTPAIKNLPSWYKDIDANISEEAKNFNSDLGPILSSFTIKHCIPVLDVISSGYLIYSPVDLIITQENGIPYYSWYNDENPFIAFHPKEQASFHPAVNTNYIPKWLNPWSIKTPKGYSCLFTHPAHRDDLPFKTMSGIVDTDKYFAPVNFVFTLKDPKFEGFIEAGTPIAQVYPFKRENWSMEFGNEEDIEKSNMLSFRLNKLNSLRYKHMGWIRKSYK